MYKGKTIGWGAHISIEGAGHLVRKQTSSHPTAVHIDITKLYLSLRDFLKNEIAKNDKTLIRIQVGIHFPDKESKLLRDLEELYTKY